MAFYVLLSSNLAIFNVLPIENIFKIKSIFHCKMHGEFLNNFKSIMLDNFNQLCETGTAPEPDINGFKKPLLSDFTLFAVSMCICIKLLLTRIEIVT